MSCAVLDIDSHRRAVAACEVAGTNLSEAVLRRGLGTAYRIFTYAAGADPDLAARLDAAEAAARAAGLGIWATTTATAGETKWWEGFRQIQLWVSAGMAFFGFTIGVLIKYGFDRRLDTVRRRHARRALAAELHAELWWAMKTIRYIIGMINQVCPEGADANDAVKTDPWHWETFRPQPMAVLDAHVGELGLLPQDVASGLIQVRGWIGWLNQLTTAMIAEVETARVSITADTLHQFTERNERIMLILINLNAPLAVLAGVEPHDWSAIEAELAEAPPDEEEPERDDAEA